MVVIQRNVSHHFICRDLLMQCRPEAGSPFVAAEIGVASGMNAVLMFQTYADLRLYLVDPWSGDQAYLDAVPKSGLWAKRLATVPLLLKEQQEWYGATIRDTEFAADRRTVLRMPSVEAALLVPDGSLSFCFIDGDHRKESVLADMDAWWPKVRAGGIFAGHDYGTRRHEGVVEAVNEWVARMGMHMDVHGRCWVIRKKP